MEQKTPMARDQRHASRTAPARPSAPLDLAHLSRMTLGDRRLQREILGLFDQQIEQLVACLRTGHPVAHDGAPAFRAAAHTLKGSARSIGAWELVQAAEAVEAALGGQGALGQAITRVAAAGARVHAAIAQMRQNEAAADVAL